MVPADPAPTLLHFGATAQRIRDASRPVMVAGNILTDITEFGRHVQEETGFPYVAGGIEHAVTAIGAAVRWSRELPRAAAGPVGPPPDPRPVVHGPTSGVWTEYRASQLLCDNGIPVVPSAPAATVEEAVAAADRFGYPVVLKAVADGLGHKSDIGGVRLGLEEPTKCAGPTARYPTSCGNADLRASGPWCSRSAAAVWNCSSAWSVTPRGG